MEDTNDGESAMPLEGIMDDTPDEITAWMISNSVADKFTVMLKECLPEGGKPVYMKAYTNRCPTITDIGKEWGPGKYKLVFSWRGENKSGKMEQMTKDTEVELPERAWRDIFEIQVAERRRLRNKKKEDEYEEELLRTRSQNKILGPQTVAPVSEFDTMKKFIGMAKELGVPIGGAVKPEKEIPKKSFMDRLSEAVPVITAIGAVVSPIAVALIGRPREKSDTTLTNTLLAHVLNKPQTDNPMKEVMPFLLGSLKQIMDVKQQMEPEEKETLVERIIGKLAPMVPMVLAMAAKGPAAVESNPVVGMVRKSDDFQALSADEEAQILAVQKLDAQYGFQQTNQILSVAGIPRPFGLADNYKKFPSNGYGPDGLSEAERAERGRAPAVAPEPNPESEIE